MEAEGVLDIYKNQLQIIIFDITHLSDFFLTLLKIASHFTN